MMNRFILCYDISDDKSRNKLAKICEKFGIRVQYSVFEFRLKKSDFVSFHEKLKRCGFLNGTYSIVFYPLHENENEKIWRYGEIRHWDKTYEII
jgi:CRISPR-associated protein Cas2